MAQDIALDEDFDVFIDDRNDLGTVEGRAEVEQSIALQVSLYFFSEIGETNYSKVEEQLKLKTRRAARENDRIDSIQSIVVERSIEEKDTYNVTISYDQTEDFSFGVS